MKDARNDLVAGDRVDAPPALYLAGPGVFAREAHALGERLRAQCSAYGFEPLHPFDNDVNESTLDPSREIFAANVSMIRRADGVLANLSPFRGAEPDSGTVWEVGFAIALGKPVWAYMDSLETNMERVERLLGPLVENRDRDGNAVENFGLPLNLMIAHSVTSISASIDQALQKAQKHFLKQQKLAGRGVGQ